MSLNLEDNFTDILSKARRGLRLEVSEVAAKAGISPHAAQAVFEGAPDEPALRALATAMELDPDRLVLLAQGKYIPEAIEPVDGLLQFTTPFGDMLVNAYLVWDPASLSAAAFDTGSDAEEMLAEAKRMNCSVELILLTHSHGDHILDLDRLAAKTGASAHIGHRESLSGAQTFVPGKLFRIGALSVETRGTWGHSPGGITYVVAGLSRPVAVVGDAMFAGSMGGGAVSYRDALKTNRENILTLPDETVLCPGHGPMTTVGEQKRVNPFFPAQ